MKIILLMASMLATFNSFAQYKSEYNWSGYWDYSVSNYQPLSYNPPVGTKTVIISVTGKNGKTKKYQKTYNELGSIISYAEFDENQKLVPIVENTFDANNLISSTKSYKKGKLKNTMEKTYLSKGKPLVVKKINNKGVVLLQNVWEYNSDSCLTKSYRYKKGNKLDRTWEYEYHSACDKSKSTLKNKSGKVIGIWSYDCKEEGQKLEKKKNETQVCKWDETNKDYLLRVQQSFNEKGEVVKHVLKYTLADTLILESVTYDSEDRLIRKSTFDKDFRKPLKAEHYVKGVLRSSYVYTYENGKKVSQTYTYKGTVKYKSVYKYDGDRLVEKKSYDKKNAVSKTISLVYS